MPTYVYEVIRNDGEPAERFEVIQRISDDPLTKHPETGEPVRRVITAAYVASNWTDGHMHRSAQDEKKLDKLGFTKYVKSGDVYEKTVGKGPDIISKDKPVQPGDL